MTIILDKNSTNYTILKSFVDTKRIVLFAGLPGVGKSLWLNQLAVLANEAGASCLCCSGTCRDWCLKRPTSLPNILKLTARPMQCCARRSGFGRRDGVLNWHKNNPNPNAMLIGEAPLIGNRFIELVQKVDDEAEAVLADKSAVFALPVPTQKVRAHIEKARDNSIANPRNEKEGKDAPTNVLQALWRDTYKLAHKLGLCEPITDDSLPEYSPAIYGNAYLALLKHRHTQTIVVDKLLKPKGSVYDLDVPLKEVKAAVAEAERIVTMLEDALGVEGVESAVNAWYTL